jgi:hypothetical protein
MVITGTSRDGPDRAGDEGNGEAPTAALAKMNVAAGPVQQKLHSVAPQQDEAYRLLSREEAERSRERGGPRRGRCGHHPSHAGHRGDDPSAERKKDKRRTKRYPGSVTAPSAPRCGPRPGCENAGKIHDIDDQEGARMKSR